MAARLSARTESLQFFLSEKGYVTIVTSYLFSMIAVKERNQPTSKLKTLNIHNYMFTFDRNIDIRLNIFSEKDAHMTSYVILALMISPKLSANTGKLFLLLVTFRNHKKDLVFGWIQMFNST